MTTLKLFNDQVGDNILLFKQNILPIYPTLPNVNTVKEGTLFLNNTTDTCYYKSRDQLFSLSSSSTVTVNNVGIGTGVIYKNTIGNVINLRTLLNGQNMNIVTGTNEVTIGTTNDILVPGNLTVNGQSDFHNIMTVWYQQKIRDGVPSSGAESFYINTSTLTLPTGPGIFNCCVGPKCGDNITTAIFTTGFGFNSLANLTTGAGNSSFGRNSCQFLTSGINNCSFGHQALMNATTASGNCIFGKASGISISTGSNNCIFSTGGVNLTTGNNNIIIGGASGPGNGITTGSGNICLNSMQNGPTTGNNNICFGGSSGGIITSGSNSILIGSGVATNLTTGSDNISFGRNSGLGLTNQNNIICIGAGADVGAGITNAVAIGPAAMVTISNSIRLGVDGTHTCSIGSNTSVNGIQIIDGQSHIVGGGLAPTGAVGTGAGTAGVPTITIDATSTDITGKITLVTGTAAAANATIFTITFSRIYGSAPRVMITPGNTSAAALSGTTNPFVSASTTINFTFTSNTTALADTTTYVWYYFAGH